MAPRAGLEPATKRLTAARSGETARDRPRYLLEITTPDVVSKWRCSGLEGSSERFQRCLLRRRNTASPRSPTLRIVRDAGSGTAPAGVPDSEKFASSSGKEAKGGTLPRV